MDAKTLEQLQKIIKGGLGIPILIVMIIAMMVLPLPPFVLDLCFTFNIALSLVVLLATIYTQRPLDLAIFPTLLLVATLLRLSLNVASTRVVLLNGHTGTHAAGQVVQSFGEVVIGGNYAVGLVVFAILVVINFVVVTKGAGRVSEVSARFTLDALPGKQMAIDADLNSGLIDQAEARIRREEVAQEADFYGAMDGSSKFVRGDAIAGILILFINVVGGLIIGLVQHNMTLANASQNYILLTIGDGLVAQLPSLLLSTAAAIIVTRVSKSQDMGGEVKAQIFQNARGLYIAAAVIAGLGLIPGMPHFVFLLFAMGTASLAYYGQQASLTEQPEQAQADATPQQEQQEQAERDLSWEDINPIDIIALEVGYRLIPLVDEGQGGQLLARIKGLRKKLSTELGFLVPSLHIRDNLDLPPDKYRLAIAGVVLGEAEVHPHKYMAINPGQVFGDIEGIKAKDPAFGLEAVWIEDSERENAQTMGYTVVDPATVIATHISQLLKANASQLMGYEEAQSLFERLKASAPKLVDELTTDLLPMSTIVKVLQQLLDEGIPISDIRTIAETLAETAHRSKEPDVLTAQVRVALNRMIIQTINGTNLELPIITMQPELEQLLQQSVTTMGESGSGLEPTMAEKMQHSLTELVQKQEMVGQPAILVVQPLIRQFMSRFIKSTLASLHVLSYQEIPDNKEIKIVGTVG